MIKYIIKLFQYFLPSKEVYQVTLEDEALEILLNFDKRGFRAVHKFNNAVIELSTRFENIMLYTRTLNSVQSKIAANLPVSVYDVSGPIGNVSMSDFFVDRGIYLDEDRAIDMFIKACIKYYMATKGYSDNLEIPYNTRVAIANFSKETLEVIQTLDIVDD